LTACILTGQRFCELNQNEIVKQINRDNLTTKGREVSTTAMSFLRGLLVIEPDDRITAKEARRHRWLTRPRTEAAQIEETYKNILHHWKPRAENIKVLEAFPRPSAPRNKPKIRQRIPDTTTPYLSLQHRLSERRQRPRQESLVNILNKAGLESGNWFVNSSETRSRFFPQKKDTHSHTVNGADMFGSIRNSQKWITNTIQPVLTHQQPPDLQEDQDEAPNSQDVCDCAVEDESDEEIAKISKQRDIQTDLDPADEQATPTESEATKRKRSRLESWNTEDKRLYSRLSKAHPPFASAKVLRESFRNKTEETPLVQEVDI
jgi:serine/threonine protein kinase